MAGVERSIYPSTPRLYIFDHGDQISNLFIIVIISPLNKKGRQPRGDGDGNGIVPLYQHMLQMSLMDIYTYKIYICVIICVWNWESTSQFCFL